MTTELAKDGWPLKWKRPFYSNTVVAENLMNAAISSLQSDVGKAGIDEASKALLAKALEQRKGL